MKERTKKAKDTKAQTHATKHSATRERAGAEKVQQRRKKALEKYHIDYDASSGAIPAVRIAALAAWRHKVGICLLTLMLFAAFYVMGYTQARDSASVLMSLNYEESNDGLNPNGTRFSMYDIQSELVMSNAIAYAGLEGVITPSALAKRLTINATNVKSEENYISSSYHISYTQNGLIHGIDANSMLSLICKAYKDLFFSSYTYNTQVLFSPIGDMSTVEYDEIGRRFAMKIDKLKRFLFTRISESDTFISDETGASFKSLNRMILNLEQYKLASLNAYVWENGIVKDSELFRSKLGYRNYRLGVRYNQLMLRYKVNNDAIGQYDEAMAAIVFIPTHNTNMEFSMSRTQLGIDKLALQADESLTMARSVKQTIRDNENKLEKLGVSINPLLIENTERLIQEITSELLEIEKLISKTNNEYLISKTRNYITFTPVGKSTFGNRSFSSVALNCATFALALCYLYYLDLKSLLK